MHQLGVARKVSWEVAEQLPGDGAELYEGGGVAHAAAVSFIPPPVVPVSSLSSLGTCLVCRAEPPPPSKAVGCGGPRLHSGLCSEPSLLVSLSLAPALRGSPPFLSPPRRGDSARKQPVLLVLPSGRLTRAGGVSCAGSAVVREAGMVSARMFLESCVTTSRATGAASCLLCHRELGRRSRPWADLRMCCYFILLLGSDLGARRGRRATECQTTAAA